MPAGITESGGNVFLDLGFAPGEAAVLAVWFKALGKVEVRLVAFRNDADPALRFDIRDGNAGKLLDTIAALPLDSGSSYGAINLRAVGDVDQVLVIGDGLSNFSNSEPELVSATGRGIIPGRTIFCVITQI